MREALPELREALPGVRLVLAAMGPKMCALAGAELRRRVLQLDDARVRRLGAAQRRGGRRATPGASTPPVFGYVRTAVGDDAGERLAKEESFYRDLHDGYRNHFDRLGEPEGTVGVAAADRDEAQAAARRLRGARRHRRPRPRERHGRGDDRGGGGRRAVSHGRAAVAGAAGRCSRSLARRSPAAARPAAGAARPRGPLVHRRARAGGDPPRRQHGLQGRLLPARGRRLRRRRRPLAAPPRLQHRPARDHLQGPRAGAALGIGRAAPTGAATSAASPAPRRCSPSSGIFTLLDFHQDLYNERFQGEGWPDWQVIDDGVPAEPQEGFPANYIVNAGPAARLRQLLGEHRGRGPRPPGRLRRRLARVAARFRDRPYVAGYDLLNEPWPGSAFNTDSCVNTAGCATFDTTTWRRSTSA